MPSGIYVPFGRYFPISPSVFSSVPRFRSEIEVGEIYRKVSGEDEDGVAEHLGSPIAGQRFTQMRVGP
jgi:hypothetical protein